MRNLKSLLVFIICFIAFISVVFYAFFKINTDQGEQAYKQETIIATFNNNYDIFQQIADFFESNQDTYYIYKTNEKFYVQMNDEDTDISSIKVSQQILDIIDELQYKGIVEYKNDIVFFKQVGEVEKAVFFVKNGKTPNKDNYRKLVGIQGDWYYYEMNHD